MAIHSKKLASRNVDDSNENDPEIGTDPSAEQQRGGLGSSSHHHHRSRKHSHDWDGGGTMELQRLVAATAVVAVPSSNKSDDGTASTTASEHSSSSQHGHDDDDLKEDEDDHGIRTISNHDTTTTTTTTSSSSSSSPNDDGNSQISNRTRDVIWLLICFAGIMASFVTYGILLEYTTSDGRKLHELSFLFITSALGTITAGTGRYLKKETPTEIPTNRFYILGLLSLGSTFCAIRSLRYVIFPIQVLFRSCKPVPVMIFGAIMGKKYQKHKYVLVGLIALGVALFMGGGEAFKHDDNDDGDDDDDGNSLPVSKQVMGVLLLSLSLCFDGGTGGYEDKIIREYNVEPFDLMFNFQLSKTVLSGVALIVFNQISTFSDMVHQAGWSLIVLGMCSAIGQVFIFITIARFGALTCSLMSLTRKVTTLTASIVLYGHPVNGVQLFGLALGITAMMGNFWKGPRNEDNNADAADAETTTTTTTTSSTMAMSTKTQAPASGARRAGQYRGVKASDDDDDDDEKESGIEHMKLMIV